MADVRRFDVEDLVNRPGTYFNPATEMLIVVDDSAALESTLLDEEADGIAEWILLADEPAVDEHRRDEIVEAFETRRVGATVPESDDEVVEEEEALEPDPEVDELR
jgi:hypothetical protein